MTQLYDRQKTLNLNKDISITVVVVGGVGYWVAKFAAMSGIEKIYLYDHDVIEEHNLNRLDLPTDDWKEQGGDCQGYDYISKTRRHGIFISIQIQGKSCKKD